MCALGILPKGWKPTSLLVSAVGRKCRETNMLCTRMLNIFSLNPISSNTTKDVGCSEGSITAAIGKGLEMLPRDVHGIDIRDMPDVDQV